MSADSASGQTLQVTYEPVWNKPHLSDEQLVELSLPDLNDHLWGLPREQVEQLKQRRRRLRNRRTAAAWRERNMYKWKELEGQNAKLKQKLEEMARENATLCLELKVLRGRYKPLQDSAADIAPTGDGDSPCCSSSPN
ncbi:transcription factor MafF-like [Gopherus flavomarginatus]|uniref:transcription factor MafF-like n=1 Tax=Gopherus flavomarginatus TaxID=286002 RepID=UPI0021CC21F9|nr:transcription factor MafF-like [Gopherus flavomarginatus]